VNKLLKDYGRVGIHGLVAIPLLSVLLATGCHVTTGGKARPVPNLLTGSTIKQVLLDGTELSKLLNQPFKASANLPPVFGGSEKLGDSFGSASPAECVGVVYMTQKGAYQSADVRNIARESWWHDGQSVNVDNVDESVVSLPTAANAQALFAKFAAQWKECDGKTLTLPSGTFVQYAITQVRVANSVVAATVSLGPEEHSILASVPEARAVGVRGNCLVEVDVSFFGNTYPSDQGTADINTSAIDIAHIMMDKISELS
jgi:hypothetical protein